MLAVVLVLVALVALEGLRWKGSVQALLHARTRIVAAHAELDALPQHADEASVRRSRRSWPPPPTTSGPGARSWAAGSSSRCCRTSRSSDRQARGVRAIRDAGAAAVAVAQSALPTAEALIAPGAEQHGTTALQRIVHAVDAQPTLRADVDHALGRLQSALDVLGGHHLWGPLGKAQRTVLTQGRRAAPTRAAPRSMPPSPRHAALGGGPHRYLVLLGNPAEERPGEGSSASMGAIEVKDGAPSRHRPSSTPTR